MSDSPDPETSFSPSSFGFSSSLELFSSSSSFVVSLFSFSFSLFSSFSSLPPWRTSISSSITSIGFLLSLIPSRIFFIKGSLERIKQTIFGYTNQKKNPNLITDCQKLRANGRSNSQSWELLRPFAPSLPSKWMVIG